MPPVSPPDRSEASSQRQRGSKLGNATGEKTRPVIKVKTPKHRKTGTKSDPTPGRWTLQPPVATKGAGPDSAGGDVFSFSPRPISKDIQKKEKAKREVLRTISKLLKENKMIRQRLTTLSQTNLKLC